MSEPEEGASAAGEDRLVSTSPRTVLGAAALMVGTILASRVLGQVRDTLTYSLFGEQGAGAGALRAAFDVPDLLYFLLAGGALRSGFVPLLTRYLNERQEERAWKTFGLLTVLVTVVSAVLVLLGMVGARIVIIPFTSGYSQEAREATVVMTRILFPAQLFMLVGGIFSGVLNSLGDFLIPALVPLVYNAAMIAAMLLFGREEQLGVYSVAWGAVAGAVIGHFLLQAWGLARKRVPFRPGWNLRDPDLREVIFLSAPVILGLCIAEINLKISNAVVGYFGEQARAAVNAASRVARLPDGIIGAGLGIALLPVLSTLAARGQMGDFRRQMGLALRVALLSTLPATVIFSVMSRPIISAVYHYGKMTAEAMEQYADLLVLFAIGIVPITLQVVITRGFYALKDTRTPVKIGLAAVFFGLIANLSLAVWGGLGPPGVAVAMSLTGIVNAAGLFYCYRRKVGLMEGRALALTAIKSLLACGGLAAVALLVEALSQRWLGEVKGWRHFIPVLLALSGGGLVYGGLLKALGVPEVGAMLELARRRLKRG